MGRMQTHNSGGGQPAGAVVRREAEVESLATIGISREEGDMQVATAKRWPRDLARVVGNVQKELSLCPKVRERCTYAVPRRDKGATKFITGPSKTFAQVLGMNYGNLAIGSKIVEIGDTYVTVRGACWDMERNVRRDSEVRRRITDKEGRRYSEDLINVTTNAALSIAERNAILKIVPETIWGPLYEAITAPPKDGKLNDTWKKVTGSFTAKKVTQEDLLRLLERQDPKDVTAEDIETLRGIYTGLTEGDLTPEEVFPWKAAKRTAPKEQELPTVEVAFTPPPVADVAQGEDEVRATPAEDPNPEDIMAIFGEQVDQ